MAKCKECGGDLVKKRNKAGEIFLVCEDCGKKYRVKQHIEEKVEAPVVEEPIVKEAPVVEEPIIKEEAPAPIVEEPVEEPAPAPVVEEPVIARVEVKEEVKKAEEEDFASIAKSLSEINRTLKAMLTLLNK